MVTNTAPNVIPIDLDDGVPKYIIIWLDDHIGGKDRYIHLTEALLGSIDPTSQVQTSRTDRDHHNLIRGDPEMTASAGGVVFSLVGFKDPDACFTAFERYRKYRIFFITSGSLGKDFLPRILPHFQDVFTDPVTNDPYDSVYVFCAEIANHLAWAIGFRDYVQIFTHEADLLTRMV
jgi:hypothetical protein